MSCDYSHESWRIRIVSTSSRIVRKPAYSGWINGCISLTNRLLELWHTPKKHPYSETVMEDHRSVRSRSLLPRVLEKLARSPPAMVGWIRFDPTALHSSFFSRYLLSSVIQTQNRHLGRDSRCWWRLRYHCRTYLSRYHSQWYHPFIPLKLQKKVHRRLWLAWCLESFNLSSSSRLPYTGTL